MPYHFDFTYLKNGTPIVTLSSFGIAFNKGAIDLLGNPKQIIIGYDAESHAIGIQAKPNEVQVPTYEFADRIRNDWIRIGAKDFIKHLTKVTGIDCVSKAKQFMPEFDADTHTLIVVVDEDHLK